MNIFKLLLRLIVIIVTWPFLIYFHLDMFLLGLVLVPIGIWLSKGDPENNWPPFLSLWNVDNVNGYIPAWWYQREALKNWFSKTFPTFYYLALRNPSNGFRHLFTEPKFETYGTEDMESEPGLQFQYRQGGWFMDMFRWTFGPVNKQAGKNEILLGWKLMDTVRGVDFTTQFRPTWLGILPAIPVLYFWWPVHKPMFLWIGGLFT